MQAPIEMGRCLQFDAWTRKALGRQRTETSDLTDVNASDQTHDRDVIMLEIESFNNLWLCCYPGGLICIAIVNQPIHTDSMDRCACSVASGHNR